MGNYVMTFDKPAEIWNDAIPLGNGRLGAMVYGQTGIDRIQLNEDSLWYGQYTDRNNRAAKDKLPEIQQKVLDGRIKEAEDLIVQYMTAAPNSMRHYEPLGELDIAINQNAPYIFAWIPHSEGAQDYRSELDLMTGIHKITFTLNGVRYAKEMFINHPSGVLCVKVTCEKPEMQLDVQLDRCYMHDEKDPDDRRPGGFWRGGGWAGNLLDSNHSIDDHTILMNGKSNGTGFSSAVYVVSDGAMEDSCCMLRTNNTSCVYLYLAGATTNRFPDTDGEVLARVYAAQEKGYDALNAEHIADFEPLMRRCELNLGTESETPLDKRIEDAINGKDDSNLAALYFMFGRYLIVSGGREGSAPLNLQGIWNKDMAPRWDSKYTTNINVQMNYWPVEVCNLSDLHQPLFDLLSRMAEKGAETARIMYGCRGAVCHHNTDFYGDCAPQEAYLASSQWQTGGAWLALHIWMHYRYTLDLNFLAKWYPVMREFAVFFIDFLIEDKNGHLVTCPTVSPENRYVMPDGHDTPICAGPAMDNQIIRELFDACAQSIRLLDITDELLDDFVRLRDRLPKNKIGSKGQLLEWQEEYPELTPGMGHISHLYGVYPGDEINWKQTPELLRAAHTSLEIRVANGAGKRGWPLAWYINEYARMLDKKRTGECIRRIVTSGGTRNFFNGWGTFQIDGNLGGTAGIAEALLQSHTDYIQLLPALPENWHAGSVRGLCARGGYVIDMTWESNQLVQAVITAKRDGTVKIAGQKLTVCASDGSRIKTETAEYGFSFECSSGTSYTLTR